MASTPSSPSSPSAIKRSFLRRILPLLLTANAAVGVYVLTRTWTQKSDEKDEGAIVKAPPSPSVSTEASVSLKTVPTEAIPLPVKARPPIPELEQRELFKWILEEKRKVKPIDSREKKRIDEEKTLLKQIIQAEYIPSL